MIIELIVICRPLPMRKTKEAPTCEDAIFFINTLLVCSNCFFKKQCELPIAIAFTTPLVLLFL